MTDTADGTGAVSSRLPQSLLHSRIAGLLPHNDIPCSLRLVDKAYAAAFSDAEHKTIRLSQPCPHHAFKHHWANPDSVKSLNHAQRLRLVCLTAASGDVANLAVAFDAAGCFPCEEMMEAAAAAGQLESCAWLQVLECPWGKALVSAGQGGHRAVLEYVLEMGCPRTEDAVYAIARGGHVGLMEELGMMRNTGRIILGGGVGGLGYFPDKLLVAAAEGCDLAILTQLYIAWLAGADRGGPARGPLSRGRQEAILAAAAGSPTHDWQAKVEWLEGLGYPVSVKAALKAAVAPDGVTRLEWLQGRGYPLPPLRDDPSTAPAPRVATEAELFRALGRDGNFAVAEYLLKSFASYDYARDAAEAAAGAGRLAFLEALHSIGRVDDRDTKSAVALAAARGGHLPVVRWAVEELKYNIKAATSCGSNVLLTAAAESGNVALLDWVWERNDSHTFHVLAAAAKSGCKEALEWMKARGVLALWVRDGRLLAV